MRTSLVTPHFGRSGWIARRRRDRGAPREAVLRFSLSRGNVDAQAMDILHKIAERRIAEALAAGALDDYAGKGEPMRLDDLDRVPEELRASYILLKSGGFLPEEIELRKEVVKLGDLIACCHEDGVREELVHKREHASLRLALLLERRGASAAWSEYGARIVERFDGRRSPDTAA
jgi:hypothetical protein